MIILIVIIIIGYIYMYGLGADEKLDTLFDLIKGGIVEEEEDKND